MRDGGARTAARGRSDLLLLLPLLLLLSLISARPAAAASSPWITNPQSQVRLVSADTVAPRHGELLLGVHFRLAPRWHVYWRNSGDAGFAPVVTWKPAPGLTPPELLWPAPHRFELPGGLEAFGYAAGVVYPVRAAIDAAPGSGRLRLAANVDYLVCEIDCVPYRYDLSLEQQLGDQARADPLTSALIAGWRHQVPLALTAGLQDSATAAQPARSPGIHDVTAQTEIVRGGATEARLELRLRGVAAAPGGADLFFESHPTLELGRPRLAAAPGELRFEAPVRRKDTSVPFPAITEIAWTATGLEQAGRPAPLALAARQRVTIAGTRAPAAPLSATAVAAPLAAGSRQGLRGRLAAADPRALALGAVAAALLALEAWGLLRARRAPVQGTPPASSSKTPAADDREPPVAARHGREAPVTSRREAAGFLALLMTLALLYALSLEISGEGLAGVELALLGMALVAWLRRRIERPALARMLLAAALAACAIAPPWLAGRNRLAGDPPAAGAAAAAGPGSSPA